MTDPLDILHDPPTEPPDPAFAARLRARLERALLAEGGAVTDLATEDPRADEWGPSLMPYLSVPDARRAIDWYVEVFSAQTRGAAYEMPDGRIGHAELRIGDAVLALADEFPEVGFVGPLQRGGATILLAVRVPDADATVARATAAGAELVRPMADEPHGRTGQVVDPFGYRWSVVTPPPSARLPGRPRPGDVVYVTLAVPDAERAKEFYGGVLGWSYAPGSVPQGWQVTSPISPMVGLWGGAEAPGAQLCYQVEDLDASMDRVRDLGGEVTSVDDRPYGRMATCTDPSGQTFYLLG